MAVEIKGKNLKEVRQAVQNGRCEFIQEYDENEFQPAARNAPVLNPSASSPGKNWTIFYPPTGERIAMLDDMFSFVDPIVEPMEDNLFHFIAQVEMLFEHPEQFLSEYQKLCRY